MKNKGHYDPKLSLARLIEALREIGDTMRWSGMLRYSLDGGQTTSFAYCTIKKTGDCLYYLGGAPPRCRQLIDPSGSQMPVKLEPVNIAAKKDPTVPAPGLLDDEEDSRPWYLLCNVTSDERAKQILPTFWHADCGITPGKKHDQHKQLDAQKCGETHAQQHH